VPLGSYENVLTSVQFLTPRQAVRFWLGQQSLPKRLVLPNTGLAESSANLQKVADIISGKILPNVYCRPRTRTGSIGGNLGCGGAPQ
jgi:hypothetical protein